MAVQWTDEQLEAITSKGNNILVAAAAGSGKTAVLVERIIRMITDEDNPVSVDRLLVLTFTEAAASEMHRKISDAIEEKLSEEPDNARLKEQSIRVGSACISTIHSFCNRIITNNVHLTNLPTGFSLIDETENKLLQARALDTVLESYYSRIDKKDAFRELVCGWGGIKGDDSLRETVLKLHNFSRSLAYPVKWLYHSWFDTYRKIEKGLSFNETPWTALLAQELFTSALNIANGLRTIWHIVENEVPSDHKYYPFYYDLYRSYCDHFEQMCADGTATSADELMKLLSSFKPKNAPQKNGLDEDVVTKINKIRKSTVKDELAKAHSLFAVFNPERLEHTAKCAPIVKALCNIVRLTERMHQRYKREKGVIDFSDLEHGLLHLLVDNRGIETPLCRRLREHYHEILLDEFQDTNILQYEIFSRLSKKHGNLFMVGDVKQCIYKFRNSDPSIFLRLYKEYDKGNGGQLIRLFKNFRSRSEVIDSVNYIFSSVMSEGLGGIDYTKEEYLIPGASYPHGCGYETEILLTDTRASDDISPELADISSLELEAQTAAQRIYDIVCTDKLLVYDKEISDMREARYSDITVLCRTSAECEAINNALLSRGIGTLSSIGIEYLDSIEVNTIISFLSIIDNPLQDIPLIAVMRSPIFRFTADELAQIRSCDKKSRFYNALQVSAKTNEKSADFLNTLLNLRECSKYMGTDELVWKICNELHYFSIVGALPGGALRKANLKLLLERCSDFEQSSMTGLFNFIQYIEMLREIGKDPTPASNDIADVNAVNIMTMHKSKGLEFPVVMLFGISKNLNFKDAYANIIWDEKFGIGMDYVDTRQRVKFRQPVRKMLEAQLINSIKSEAVRLLYVAMTRAKEKLIISSSVSVRANKWTASEFDENGILLPVFSDMITCMRDWILAPLMNNPHAGALRSFADRHDIIPTLRSDAVFDIHIVSPFISDSVCEDEKNQPADTAPSYPDIPDLHERLDYVYPHSELGRLPIKLSVSELKRRSMPEESYSAGYAVNTPPVTSLSENDFDAAERGTITHFILQHLDLSHCETEEEILGQIDKMVETGVIRSSQRNAVNINSIIHFFESDLGTRLRNAERIEREYDFYMLIPPTALNPDIVDPCADDIILQGIADCFFFEDDGIVLLDYKTDRVDSNNAEKRSKMYKMQIDSYARGLSEILGLPVKEKYLYFLNCSEYVKM